ncbi:MAG: hypothetical protein IJZ00_05700 [Lachnospiraceae bacterium]|nr:hypothetical protein [Lachnospiraceae bacterium]
MNKKTFLLYHGLLLLALLLGGMNCFQEEKNEDLVSGNNVNVAETVEYEYTEEVKLSSNVNENEEYANIMIPIGVGDESSNDSLEINSETTTVTMINPENIEESYDYGRSENTTDVSELVTENVAQNALICESGTYVTDVDALEIISDCMVANSGSYAEWWSEPQRVFGEDRYNAFSIGTNACYNMWGYGTQYTYLNTTQITELNFSVGLADGGCDTVTLNVFYNDEERARYSYEVHATRMPLQIQLDLSEVASVKIEVINNSGSFNRTVFYDLWIR